MAELIKSSLSPAENLTVTLDNQTKVAKVLCPEDQLSMAIGKDGQNVRLTAKLTGYRIEVEGNGEYSTSEEKAEGPEPVKQAEEPVVKKITKTKAKKLAKKAKLAEADEPKVEIVENVFGSEDVKVEQVKSE